MRIKWLAHAAFLIEGEGVRVLTDPYEPNGSMNLPPITEAVDLVIRSSDDDSAHSHVDTIPPGFDLVTATEIVGQGATVRGLAITAVAAKESLAHKEIVGDNALYRFMLEGITLTHMGDVGNPLNGAQMAALEGTDILFALAGGPPTIELADLHGLIATIRPRLVIPMHFRIPGPRFFMLPVTEFTARYPEDRVRWAGASEVEISRDSLPEETHILVLEPALVGTT